MTPPRICWIGAWVLVAASLAAQTPPPANADLSAQIQQLRAALAATQAQLAQEQAALSQLETRLASAEDQQAVASGKIDDQEQTKVASGSHARLTLSGLLLMNAYSNSGVTENSDVPNLALPSSPPFTSGALGATLRQSEITLRASGPEIWGAHSSGELIADFFGGLPNSLDGSVSGLARLKIARGRLDWSHRSLLFGEDAPFIAPLSPTSYASLGTPALAYSGNLWTWTPQLVFEQRDPLGAAWRNTFQAGLLDPLDGEFPARLNARVPEAGELSRVPGFALHEALGRDLFDRDFSFGAGMYGSRQSYGFGRSLQAWALTADWNLALAPALDLSGEAFRGRGIGGLWGGIGTSIVSSSPDLAPSTTQIAGVNAAGGWAQLKLHLSPALQLNAAYGLDNAFARDLARFAATNTNYPFARNHSALFNVIDQPRSDLVLSLEYRRIYTTPFEAPTLTAAQINAAIGVIF